MNRTLLAAVLLCAVTAGAQQVRYRSADTVYLTQGSAEGVAVGDRFEIVRKDAVIATVEVIFVAEHSASAKVIRESATIAAGDAARRVGGTARPAPPPPQPAPILAPLPSRSPFSLSGTLTFDAGDDRSVGRLSLRARHIADLPLHARVRARAASTEQGNRLYEASLSYEGRILGARVGRIGNTPYVGLGYLDGAIVSVNVADFLQVGAFGGLQPDVTELTFDAGATKYGAFARVFTGNADLVVAAATVEDHPFAAVDARWAATPSFSLFAHGRVGDEAFDAMAGAIAQLTPRQSVTVSYERVDPGPDDDLRTTDQVINDFLRQGVRVSYRGPYATLGAGLRSGDEGDDDPTYSAHAGLSHPNLFGGVYAGIHATGFSSALSDGLFAQVRAGRRFGGGHNVELAAGALLVDETALEELSSTAYVRASVWIELPYDLFARGEAEFSAGDTRTGHRVSLGAGYRF